MKIYKNTKILFTISLISSITYATQAIEKNEQEFFIPKHSFTNQEIYDNTLKQFKKLNGTNYYAIKSNTDINDITLFLNNSQNTTPNMNEQNATIEILTPDFTENFKVTSQHGFSVLEKEFKDAIFIPFITTAYVQNANANNNKLILEEGELSSEIYFKPQNIKLPDPKAKNSEIAHNFIITAALVNGGEYAQNNQTIIKNAYINIEANDDYTVSLNGAPYILGAMGINADVISNTLLLESGSMIDIHASIFKKDRYENIIEDEKITHLIGGFTINGLAKNNKLIFNGTNLVTHGTYKAYSANSAAHIIAAYVDVNNNANYDATNNTLEINNLNLGLNFSKASLTYSSVFFAEFWGGKTEQGNALQNKIYIKDLQTLHSYDDSTFIQGSYNFYAGEANKGEANSNEIHIKLDQAFFAHENFTGENIFGFYGGYGTKGANSNIINLENDLTQLDIAQNYKDKINIVAAKTLEGKANFNEIHIKNSLSSLPLFIYGVQKAEFKDKQYFAQEANHNKIYLDTLISARNLSIINEAQNCNNNLISYNNVQSLSEASNISFGSKTIIKALKNANSNTIILNNYSSATPFNEHYIIANEESAYNNIFIDTIAMGTASDKREGNINIIAGLSKNSHHNTLSIKNLNIDEYKNDNAIFIAPSALNLQNNAKSYDNTLYLGGEFNTFENTLVDAISGALMYSEDALKVKLNIAPSLQEFSKNNRLILDTNAKAKMVNNFEHFTFIISDMTMFDSALLDARDLAINLSRQGILQLFAKDGFKVKKGEKITLIHSNHGFVDENGNFIDSELKFKDFFKQFKNNKDNFDYKNFQSLKGNKLESINYELEISKDFTTIYALIK
ncbi:hypothetical protein OLQ22_04120 [Campylobacter jejuni]|nr:hypothetical protein [Campylobacter jejuni]